MLRLALAALYVSLKLVSQHRFYLSEFCIAKLALLIHFLKVSQQVASGSSVSNGLIAQFSHHHECHGNEEGKHQEPKRQLPGRRREKLQHASTRAPQFPCCRPLLNIMHIAERRSSFVVRFIIRIVVVAKALVWLIRRISLRREVGRVQSITTAAADFPRVVFPPEFSIMTRCRNRRGPPRF
jgi:hypothetical protein